VTTQTPSTPMAPHQEVQHSSANYLDMDRAGIHKLALKFPSFQKSFSTTSLNHGDNETSPAAAVASPKSISVVSHQYTSYSWQCLDEKKSIEYGDGIRRFVWDFFVRVQTLSSYHGEIMAMFRHPRRSKECMLVEFITNILSIDGESWEVKKGLRALGRSMAARGVRMNHLLEFKEIFLETFSSHLHTVIDDGENCEEILAAWQILLTFVVEEMTVENVQFRRHDSSSSPEPMSGLPCIEDEAISSPMKSADAVVSEAPTASAYQQPLVE